jgi:hypothetical protein
MYKAIAFIANLLAALTLGDIFQAGVSLDIQAPTEVVAGTEFEVKVTIQKGELQSFSRLQQTFPAGLKAVSSQSSNADFTFEEKRVRLIWLRLPTQSEFTVVYKIKVDERLKGDFTIDGKFSYIDENERKSVSAVSLPIQILPSPTIDPSLIVDIDDFEEKVIPYISPATAEPQMACIRQSPVHEKEGNGYIVNLLVNKESKQKFAKIEEIIPSGYKAVSVNPGESIFTFKNNTAKFLWMNLPSTPYFIVSYKLEPVSATVSSPVLKGEFSYLEGEKTISIDIKQTDQDLASLSSSDIGNLITALNSPLLANRNNIKEKEIKSDLSAKETPIETKTQQKEDHKEKIPKSNAIKTPQKELKNNQAYLLEPEEGIYYRVQLAAGHKTIDIQKYFKKYNLDKEVRKEIHEGWNKYSIGSFKVYKEARDYRVHIWNTTIIDDAFVSAYNNGKRITVQEALMIANQTWYK